MRANLTEDAERQIMEAVSILKKGGVVAFPTDTVYGIGAGVDNENGAREIYEIKGRPRAKPLQVFLSDVSALGSVARQIPEMVWRVAEALLPGGLTLILWRQPWLSDVVTAGGDTVAVRIPDHSVPLALVRELGLPLAATSANLSNQPSAVVAEDVRLQLGQRVRLIIDGGRCPEARESTILDLTAPVPRILREGAVSRESIETVCGAKVVMVG
ncbi:MAG: L-threonylcarbamoyladenylate synthase [Chloroflexota bacterium]